jgi:hypothetical protein
MAGAPHRCRNGNLERSISAFFAGETFARRKAKS